MKKVSRNVQRLESEEILTNNLSTSARQLSYNKIMVKTIISSLWELIMVKTIIWLRPIMVTRRVTIISSRRELIMVKTIIALTQPLTKP